MLAQKSKSSGQTIAVELNNYWFTKQLTPIQRAFQETELIDGIETLRNLDFQLKDSKLESVFALTLAVQRLARRQTPPVRSVY